MARDEFLTMDNFTLLTIDTGNLSVTTPGRDTGAALTPVGGPVVVADSLPLWTPSQGLIWHLIIDELEGTALEGVLVIKLQMSLDGSVGGTFEAANEVEWATADPAMTADQTIRSAINVGRDFRSGANNQQVTDPTLINFRTEYSTTGRSGDTATTLRVTSYLSTQGSFTGD